MQYNYSRIFPAQFDKMPEHTSTCHRVQVGVTPQGIVDHRTVEIFMNTDTTGNLGRARHLSNGIHGPGMLQHPQVNRSCSYLQHN
jgi:hypothetical protein